MVSEEEIFIGFEILNEFSESERDRSGPCSSEKFLYEIYIEKHTSIVNHYMLAPLSEVPPSNLEVVHIPDPNETQKQ